MANTQKMIELPELAIRLISEQLSYEDLRNLRVTCKKLQAIVDRRTFRSLHLFVKKYPFERELLHTGELVSHANTFYVRRLDILKSIKFKSQFTGLRKLTIFCERGYPSMPKSVDLDDLNCFEGLVHLELKQVAVENGKLSLRNLKIALFQNSNHETTNFDLACPQLQVLGLVYQTRPRLTRETSNSVRHLYLHDTRSSETYLFLLYAKLQGLSTICFYSHCGSEGLNNFVRALMERRVCLPLLKRIRLKDQWFFPDRGVLLRNLARLKSRQETKHIEVLINRKMLSSDELIQMLDLLNKRIPGTLDDLDDPTNPTIYFGTLESDLLRHYIENPILHCLLPSVCKLRLWSVEDVILSKQLIERLINLEQLAIGIALDEQFFECILKTCRRICGLQIVKRAHFKQQQLDLMPDYLQNLTFLTFGYKFEQGNFNLHFVTKFKNLNFVAFNFNIPKETMSFLFKNCHHPQFQLELNGMQTIWIHSWRNKNGRFVVICCHSLDIASDSYKAFEETEFDCLEDAIEHYYRNDLFYTLCDERTERAAFHFQCCLI